MSNGAELQSMPISSPTLRASSALKLVTPVRSVTGIDEAVVSALRMMATARETDRVRALVETGIAINSELSLDGVLERIIEAAARLTGAQYAALGVIDRSGGGLERFVTYGISSEVETQIGNPPTAAGSSAC